VVASERTLGAPDPLEAVVRRISLEEGVKFAVEDTPSFK
jgi:hypothetical protein